MSSPSTLPSAAFDQAYNHPWQYLLDHREDVVRVFSETPATIIALIALTSLLTLSIYWLIHRGKINGRDAKIIGLERDVSFLERQKADLENKVKDLEQKPLQRTEKKEGMILTPDTQQQLVATLKKYGEDPANVSISFAEMRQRPLADTLIAVFELAGWRTSLENIPRDSYHPHRPYVQGTEVLGYNKHLVEAVTDALKTAGLSEAKATVGETQVKRDNPKWNSIQHSIRITIEHHE